MGGKKLRIPFDWIFFVGIVCGLFMLLCGGLYFYNKSQVMDSPLALRISLSCAAILACIVLLYFSGLVEFVETRRWNVPDEELVRNGSGGRMAFPSPDAVRTARKPVLREDAPARPGTPKYFLFVGLTVAVIFLKVYLDEGGGAAGDPLAGGGSLHLMGRDWSGLELLVVGVGSAFLLAVLYRGFRKFFDLNR